jgi:hypothetical protein
MIVYLHGFNSAGSVNNDKVIGLQKIDEVHIVTYDSFSKADEIIDKICDEIEHLDDIVFIGTSLGAFFAAQLGKKFNAPCVLINPLFKPEVNLMQFLGVEQKNYVTGSVKFLTPYALMSYAALPNIVATDGFAINPLIIIAEDDELIPFEMSAEYFSEHEIILTEKGGHRFNNIGEVIGDITRYINQANIATDLNS